MKESLKKYQNNELNALDTEGVEKRLIGQAVEREMRQKWGKLLSENGIDKSISPVVEEQDPAKDPVFMAVKRKNQQRFIMGIAASLLLVACFWWWDVHSTSALDLANSALFNERFAAPSVRMGQNDDLKNWADAKNAYHDAHFDAAIPLIEAIATPSSEQQFYLALSHIYAQKPDFEKAASGFKNIMDNKDDNFKDEARWYYALTALKLGRNDDAKQNLEIITKNHGWKSKEADALLEKLKN
jgi:tetratricopeptide (TPR) repeat protein